MMIMMKSEEIANQKIKKVLIIVQLIYILIKINMNLKKVFIRL